MYVNLLCMFWMVCQAFRIKFKSYLLLSDLGSAHLHSLMPYHTLSHSCQPFSSLNMPFFLLLHDLGTLYLKCSFIPFLPNLISFTCKGGVWGKLQWVTLTPWVTFNSIKYSSSSPKVFSRVACGHVTRRRSWFSRVSMRSNIMISCPPWEAPPCAMRASTEVPTVSLKVGSTYLSLHSGKQNGVGLRCRFP